MITLRSPIDMHLHLREGTMLKLVAPLSASSWAGGVIMPNLVPPVDSLERLLSYRASIEAAIENAVFEPWMTLFFKEYSEAELAAAAPHIIGIKLYPQGVTTNSEGGVGSLAAAERTLAMMEEQGIPLLVHGEDPEAFVMDREASFLSSYEDLATRFPKLKITMEHITTAGAVALLDRFENLRATVTLQHLLITLDDVAGGLFRPHMFCKPIAKRPEDREALLGEALAAHPKLMFGSDSAPHPQHKKECCGCAAGCFTAPNGLAWLAELFDQHGALENLQAFVSDTAREQYGITPPETVVELVKEPSEIPAVYGAETAHPVVPLFAEKTCSWRIAPC